MMTDPIGDTETGTTGEPGECGDGAINVGEECYDGMNNGPGLACTADCTANACGDGDQGPGEECDNGAMNGDMNGCKADCTNNVCGDGAVGPGEGGTVPEYGVNVPTWYQGTSILANHGPGQIVLNPNCTNP